MDNFIFDLTEYDPEWLHGSGLNAELINRYHVIPLKRSETTLQLGLANINDDEAISAIAFHTGLKIHPILIDSYQLDKIINTLCRPTILYSQLKSAIENNDASVIEFVNQLIFDAINKNISDIHIEPYHHHCRIRFRRDGLLYEVASIPPPLATQVAMRLKIMSQLNIAEKRLPQDGRIHILDDKRVNIRINTCPTLYGEKIALRILDSKQNNFAIDSLGMTNKQTEFFAKYLSRPQGLILVTGPTGSGKTVTLYSALNYLNSIEKNISTVEDPVEIELPGITQVNINPRIGLNFSSILRTLLRQDPDIIMIGEIRDIETANIAIQAAETGHLVLSTLHTTNVLQTSSRLQSLGITYEHLLYTEPLIIAQRLIRTLCQACKNTHHVGNGCNHCHSGFKGRTGIFELLSIGSENHHEQMGLWEAGLSKIKHGITNDAELRRVLGQDQAV